MSASSTAVYPPAPTTVRSVSTKLVISPKGDKLVYCNGRSVIVRSLEEPGLAFDYTGHTATTTVARFSPSGNYIASGDSSGKVRIWDSSQDISKYHNSNPITKLELQIFSGPIKDLAWDGESARVIAVGGGRDRFGHAFSIDGGNSVGEIGGHSKVINAVSIRQSRPFKAVTASDDNTLVFFQGAPYRFVKTIQGVHTNFVNDVAYSPNGDHFISAGSDSRLVLFDGKTGDLQAELQSGSGAGHKGTIFAISWSKDSRQIVSAGADGTIRLWDVDTKECAGTWEIGVGLENQQLGVVWAKEKLIVALSFDGRLRFLSTDKIGETTGEQFVSPQKGITALIYEEGQIISGSYDGTVYAFNAKTGKCQKVQGQGHRNQVTSFSPSKGDSLLRSAGMDDTVRTIKVASGVPGFVDEPVKLSGLPKTICGSKKTFVNLTDSIQVLQTDSKHAVKQGPILSMAISPAEDWLACGTEDGKTLIFDTSSMELKETLTANRAAVSVLSFSPKGSFLAAGDGQGKIMVYDVKKGFQLKTSHWVFHTGRVTTIDWTTDEKHAASGGLDSHLYIWSTEKTMKNIAIKNVHLGGTNGVVWCSDDRLASAGTDACVKIHEVVHV